MRFFSTHGRSTAGLADSPANGCFAGCRVRRFTSFGIRGHESVGQVRHFLPELFWIAGLLAHVSRVRGWAGPNEGEFRRFLCPVWQAAKPESAGSSARRFLASSADRRACHRLCSSLVGKREGIAVGVRYRRGCAWGADAGQKTFELKTDGRFHWQGRWGYPGRPERLSQWKGRLRGLKGWGISKGSNADAAWNPTRDHLLQLNALGPCRVVRGWEDWL